MLGWAGRGDWTVCQECAELAKVLGMRRTHVDWLADKDSLRGNNLEI